jgi:hypothetical protein
MDNLTKKLSDLKNSLKNVMNDLEKADYIEGVSLDDLTDAEKKDAKTLLDYSKYITPLRCR